MAWICDTDCQLVLPYQPLYVDDHDTRVVAFLLKLERPAIALNHIALVLKGHGIELVGKLFRIAHPILDVLP
jgi:hypothetical protein